MRSKCDIDTVKVKQTKDGLEATITLKIGNIPSENVTALTNLIPLQTQVELLPWDNPVEQLNF